MKLSEIMQKIFNELKVQSWIEHRVQHKQDIFLRDYYFQICVKSIDFDFDDSLSERIINYLEGHSDHQCEWVMDSGLLTLYYATNTPHAVPKPLDLISALEKSMKYDVELMKDKSDYRILLNQTTTTMVSRYGMFREKSVSAAQYHMIDRCDDLQCYRGKVIVYTQERPPFKESKASFAYVLDRAYVSDHLYYTLIDLHKKLLLPGDGLVDEDAPVVTIQSPLIKVDKDYLNKNILFVREPTKLELEKIFVDIEKNRIDVLSAYEKYRPSFLRKIKEQVASIVDQSLAMSNGH